MSKKLKLNPEVSYVLGMYAYSPSKAVGIVARNGDMLERFIKIVLKEFDIAPDRIQIQEEGSEHQAYFYNTKLKKLLDKALERKDKTFAYKNAYAASYLAGIFDAKGWKNEKGMFIKGLKHDDAILMERLGFHTRRKGMLTRLTNPSEFVNFIKQHSSLLN